MKIEKINFHGLEAVRLDVADYEAIVIPSVGANLVRLFHKKGEIDMVRTPLKADIDNFKSRPQVYGIPMLFPPNRIADGCYSYNGVTYQFPITIPGQNNYHHGIIKSQPFVVTKTIIHEDAVELEAAYYSNLISDSIYTHFPHAFECRVNYLLSNAGLEHTVTFVNDGDTDMPLGVGYHTPINVPFQAEPGTYKMWLTAGEEWELNERSLPTGNLLPLDEQLQLLRTQGLDPVGEAIERSVTNKPFFLEGEAFSGAIIANLATGVKLFYEVDEQFQHWTIWNSGGAAGFICPEPQTWAINAPNLNLPDEVTGFQVIEPGDAWSATTKLYIK